ncbi:MAG: 4-(cytidine 5'-diphospho)-2-C-methyl-D-erythritol kinase [Cyclobacteriaceae bacterium]|nr:4-(cytidine 5'-diphospho)-2-C-methyl-D-erythritol kinase [Cyclobacteriaceae bacterium]
MVTFPPCKINLGLHVLSKRSDGYHDLSTCFYPLPFTDVLEILPAETWSFTQTGIPVPGSEADNLCSKAYHLLKNDFAIGSIRMHLHKIVPMGAGLGGGSSDAAYVLRSLNQIFNLNLSTEKLMQYASRLGSDCAFFIQDQPQMGSGRGEILSDASVSLKGWYCVLIKPPVHVSTAEAYAGIVPAKPTDELSTILKLPIDQWRTRLINDFETSVFKKHPEIKVAKDSLYECGATYASMTGSGAAVYGIFKNEVDVRSQFSGQWLWSGQL